MESKAVFEFDSTRLFGCYKLVVTKLLSDSESSFEVLNRLFLSAVAHLRVVVVA